MAYCNWDLTSELNMRYHDEEWGRPLHSDRGQFEFLMMEVMQCGLNWNMMIQKREIFRSCFDNFDYDKVASYDESDIERIMNTEGMIRSRRKIEAVINNARCFQKIREKFGTFSEYLWAYSDGRTILYNKHGDGYIPVSNGLSDRISKDLKKQGFKYLGTVTVYSHLQACGIICDHGSDCPCYKEIVENYPTVTRRIICIYGRSGESKVPHIQFFRPDGCDTVIDPFAYRDTAVFTVIFLDDIFLYDISVAVASEDSRADQMRQFIESQIFSHNISSNQIRKHLSPLCNNR